MSLPFVSIVIPVLRDTQHLAALLQRLAPEPADEDSGSDDVGGYEVIVANGDTADPTLEQARSRFPTVRWTASPPGRGRQMNVGARLATGEWLLFLHADTCVSAGWLDEIRRVARNPKAVGGAFRFTLQSSATVARGLERGVAWRVRWLGLPYGDQGLFVRRTTFDELGGYRALAIMEDVDLARRLGRCGQMIYSRVPILVSPRRWERDGWGRRTVANLLLLALYYIGVSPDRLARAYYGRSPGSIVASATPVTQVATSLGRRGIRAPQVAVIIPALNEAEAISGLLADIPDFVTTVTVVDNGSTDATAERARAGGARVVSETRRGYGRACLAGLQVTTDADIIVFLDADRSDYPEDMTALVAPVAAGEADLVMGCRDGVARPIAARLGTALCVRLVNLIWRTQYRDLGPFRAIRRRSLDRMRMTDQTYGWTIEMQVKAAEANLRVFERPIRQRPRIGQSKISGTLLGAASAGTRMLFTIWSLWRTRRTRRLSHG